ncbi:MAG: hypothetical protein HYV07_32240 [Deltaproteobacteria bacterium]|nr:hypothetical protein [Deltaproteobacteria bacterium]
MTQHIGEDLFDLARETLPEPRASECRAHVESCSECRDALESTRRLLAAMDAPALEPSPTFDQKLARRLDELDRELLRPWYSRLFDRVPLPALVAPALVAAAVGVVALWPEEPPAQDASLIADAELLEDLDLFREYSTVENLDVLDDLDVLEEMEEAG